MTFSRQDYWSRVPFPSPGDSPSLSVFFSLSSHFRFPWTVVSNKTIAHKFMPQALLSGKKKKGLTMGCKKYLSKTRDSILSKILLQLNYTFMTLLSKSLSYFFDEFSINCHNTEPSNIIKIS